MLPLISYTGIRSELQRDAVIVIPHFTNETITYFLDYYLRAYVIVNFNMPSLFFY